MKVNFVNVFIGNFRRKTIKIKLPKKNKDLQEILIKTEVTEAEKSAVKDLDNPFKTVTDIELKNFKIKKPTNIYYLNCYLEILKEKNIDLPEEELEINTNTLKKMIADLLDCKDEDMELDQIYDLINKKLKEQKDSNSKENEGMTLKESKPKFSIKELQRKHIERKGT